MNGDFHDYMCIAEKNDFIHFLHSNTNACINNKNINPIHDEIINLKVEGGHQLSIESSSVLTD